VKLTHLEWDEQVGLHLKQIVAGAEMCLFHVRQLPVRPDFETKAEAAMEQCAHEMIMATADLLRAIKEYQNKPVEIDDGLSQ
jgi:hypothetical protein